MKFGVVIIEDDSRFRSTLAHVVLNAPDMILLGTADDIASGRALIQSARPDVVLVDIGLPSGSGVELIRVATDQIPSVNVMVVSVFGDEANILTAIAAGARGYVLKSARTDDIADQIRTLRSGGSPISPIIARKILTRLSEAHLLGTAEPGCAEPLCAKLSTQEFKVLSMSAKGHTYEEVARIMGISRQTVLTYVKRSYVKLQVHSKSEAVSKAYRAGLLSS